MSLPRVAALSVALLLLGAKPSRSTPRSEPPPESPAATSAATSDGASGSATAQAMLSTMELSSSVTVLDPGAMPRQVLRFAPRPGATATVEQTQQMSMRMVANGQEMALPGSGVITTSRTSVGEPDAAGVIPVTVEQLGVRATPGSDPAVANAAGGMVGIATRILVSPEGQIVGFSASGGSDPAAAALVDSLGHKVAESLAVLPKEAMGVGGRFQTVVSMDMSGLSLKAETTSTIRAITDDAVDLDIVIAIGQGDGPSNLVGLPPGAEVTFDQMSGTGSGSQHVDLHTLAPLMNQKMSMDIGMSVAGPQGAMSLTMHLDQEISSRLVE